MRKIFVIALLFAFFASACKDPGSTVTPEPEKKTDARQFFKDNADRLSELCSEWEPDADLLYTHYAFIDLDSDGIEELYISQDEESPYGWLLCCGGDSLQMITTEDQNFHISHLGNIVEMSGMFPSGTAYTKYFEIENSKVIGPEFMGKGQKDFITDELILNFYYVDNDDVPYPVDKTKPFKDKVMKLRTSGKSWIPFKEVELEEDPLGVFLGKMPAEDPDPEDM